MFVDGVFQFKMDLIKAFQLKSYQQAKLQHLTETLQDSACQTHKLFRALHASPARENMTRLEDAEGHLILDPQTIVHMCRNYFRDLLGSTSPPSAQIT